MPSYRKPFKLPFVCANHPDYTNILNIALARAKHLPWRLEEMTLGVMESLTRAMCSAEYFDKYCAFAVARYYWSLRERMRRELNSALYFLYFYGFNVLN